MLFLFKRSLSFLLCCVLSLSSALLAAKCHQNSHSTVDYVIVGVGTAGGIVAKKLTDDRKTSVIAIQAGKNLTYDPLIRYSEFASLTVAAGLVPEPPLARL